MTNQTTPRFRRSAESTAIIKILQSAAVGELITYKQIASAAGENEFSSRVRTYLQTARKSVFDEFRIVFDAVTGVGLKRLNDSEIVNLAQSRVVNIRRATGRASAIASTPDFSNLSKDDKNKALTVQAQVGAMKLASSIKTTRQIEQATLNGTAMHIGDTLSFFEKSL